MESTHVISISNGEDNVAPRKSTRTFKFSLPPVFSRFRESKIHLRDKQKKDAKKMIHSIKVGISLVLISLLYLLDPLYEQVGENAMWAIMTVVVTFEFSAGRYTFISNTDQDWFNCYSLLSCLYDLVEAICR